MEKLQVRVEKDINVPKYIDNVDDIVIFLRHEDDKIIVQNGEIVNIDVIYNGYLIFSGNKYDFFETLKKGLDKN